MINREILKKVVGKVAENGWKGIPYLQYTEDPKKAERLGWKKTKECDDENVYIEFINDRCCVIQRVDEWIFSHDFAEAYWKKELICDKCGCPKSNPQIWHFLCESNPSGFKWKMGDSWKYHRLIMGLKDDPIKYLEKFL
jgi:hypothetical protein